MDALKMICQSPRRVMVAVVVVLALGLAGSAAFGLTGSKAKPVPAAAPVIPAQVPQAGPYVSHAVLFVKLWSQLQPGQTPAEWASLLGPVTTPELGEALKTTDPSMLPGVPQQGMPAVHSINQTSAIVAVPLADGSSVLVTVVDEGPRLLVYDVQPNQGDS